jgi:hypothetical protein
MRVKRAGAFAIAFAGALVPLMAGAFAWAGPLPVAQPPLPYADGNESLRVVDDLDGVAGADIVGQQTVFDENGYATHFAYNVRRGSTGEALWSWESASMRSTAEAVMLADGNHGLFIADPDTGEAQLPGGGQMSTSTFSMLNGDGTVRWSRGQVNVLTPSPVSIASGEVGDYTPVRLNAGRGGGERMAMLNVTRGVSRVDIVDATTGVTLWTIPGEARSLMALPDLDGDGWDDVGQWRKHSGGNFPWLIDLAAYSSGDGALLWEATGLTAVPLLSGTARGAVDLNGDQVPELLLHPVASDTSGELTILDGASGVDLFDVRGDHVVVAEVGDRGVPELVVQVQGPYGAGTVVRAVTLDGQQVWSTNSEAGLQALGDLDGDGADEILLGDWHQVRQVTSARDGHVLWSLTSDHWLLSGTAGGSATDVFDGAGWRMLDGGSGAPLWTTPRHDHDAFWVTSGDLDDDGLVDSVVTDGDGAYAYSGADGQPLWTLR